MSNTSSPVVSASPSKAPASPSGSIMAAIEKLRVPSSPLWRRDIEQAVADRRLAAAASSAPSSPSGTAAAAKKDESVQAGDAPAPATTAVEDARDSALSSPEERVRQARATLQALAAEAADIDRRYPAEPSAPDAEIAERNRLIAALHDRIRVLEHALHLPPYPYPLYYPYMATRPFPPLPLPSDKDVAIRRLIADNRLLRETVTALQRAVREYELHYARVVASSSGSPKSPSRPSVPRLSSPLGSASSDAARRLRMWGSAPASPPSPARGPSGSGVVPAAVVAAAATPGADPGPAAAATVTGAVPTASAASVSPSAAAAAESITASGAAAASPTAAAAEAAAAGDGVGESAPAAADVPPAVSPMGQSEKQLYEQLLQMSEHSARLSADNLRLYDELTATEAAYHVRVMDLSSALANALSRIRTLEARNAFLEERERRRGAATR